MDTVRQHRVSVRDLVETVERSGDINYRFSGRSTALAGIRGHQRVQKSRGDDYVAEKEVSRSEQLDQVSLSIGGRVDGYFPATSPMLVEEIKTIRADAAEIPEAIRRLHRGQCRVYAYFLACEHEADEVLVRICYLQLDDDSEVFDEELMTRESLGVYYHELLSRYFNWLTRLDTWIGRRDQGLAEASFPFAEYRKGQREVAVSVYRSLKDESQVVLQAPTGIGKTMATLFPAIKALGSLAYDKVFFLTAKTSGQQAALTAIRELKQQGIPLREVALTAKERICFTPGAPCDPEHCEYAGGYYDRLPAALDSEVGQTRSLDRENIEIIAREHTLCPFELSLDLSLLADVVVCDYNYVFDPTVYLRRFFDDSDGRYALLVDEAHNLVDRGRDMFSAEIEKSAFLKLRRDLKEVQPSIARRLAAVNSALLALIRPGKESLEKDGYLLLDDVPAALLQSLKQFCGVAEDWLSQNQPSAYQETLLTLYFDSLRFLRTMEYVDDTYAILVQRDGKRTRIRLNNVNPSPGLARGLARGKGSVCFSATMTPQPYFQAMLGAGQDAAWYKVDSPFDSANLNVITTPFISTAFRDRERSLYELVDLIAGVVGARQGNYIVFFPSYAYLNQACDKFAERYQQYQTIQQTPGMELEARDAFLDEFVERDTGTLVGFAVMGGVFGEGVDLRGTRLIGVVIAGVGLPQLGIDRDLIRQYFDDHDGRGFEFAYQFPGINRVLQTAGRVIRTESDRGVVCLVDSRFAENRYRRLLPREWDVVEARSREQVVATLDAFWGNPIHV